MPDTQTSTARPKVLIVEDEFLIRITLVEALGDEGFDVLEAESADEALPVLQQGGVQLLLTDIKLPGKLDGRGLADLARAQDPTLPIIFMTGQPDPGDRPNDLNVFISKPYTLTAICDAARRLTRLPARP